MINTGGEKVHPQEVEDVLLAQPGVTDASVVGVPDETWGERVVAVVATQNATVTGQQLKDALRRRLAGYKVPRSILLLPALPRTPPASSNWPRSAVSPPATPRQSPHHLTPNREAGATGVPSTHIAG